MKTLRYLLLGLSLTLSSAAFGQSVLDKVKEGAERAVHATKRAVRTAADKVGQAVETTTDKVKEAVKPDDDEKERTVKQTTVTTTTGPVAAPTPIVTTGVADPATILPQVEQALGRKLTPEERARYMVVLETAQTKARSAENELAVQITELTGLDPVKSGEIVRGNGL